MHLSMSSFCCLCGDPDDLLINILSDSGKKDDLEKLVDQYIVPLVCLPKDDRLCVCDTCKTRLLSWDSFIKSCKKAQDKFKDKCTNSEQKLAGIKKRCVDATDATVIPQSSHKKKRSSNYCIARWCNKGNYQGVSLFRFPKDRDRAITWLTAAERTDMKCMPTFHCYYLCANHFTPNMFTNKACNQLVKQAVPTLFPRPSYADKIALKAATSQILPTQLQGIQLKTILPKTNSSDGSSASTLNLPMKEARMLSEKKAENTKSPNSVLLNLLPQVVMKETPQSEESSNFVIGIISPSLSNNAGISENVYHLLQSAPSLGENHIRSELSPHGLVSDSIPCLSTSSPQVVKQVSSSTYYSIAECDSTPEPVYAICMTPEIKSDSHVSLLRASGEHNLTKLEHSSIKEQTNLEELGSCFVNDTFSSNNLLCVSDVNQGSTRPNCTGFKNNGVVITEISDPAASCSTSDIQSQFINQNDNFQPTVGSQDLLLAHVSDKINRPSTSFSEQTFALGPDVSADASEAGEHAVSLCVLTEPTMLNHQTEVNTTHIGLFGLQADEGTENSSFINNMENLDDLMDLDHFFEGR